MYEKKLLGLEEARAVIDAVLTAAADEPDRPIVVAVVDPDGDTIAFARMDAVAHISRSAATRKAYTSARCASDSGSYGVKLREAGIAIGDLGDPLLIGFPGGVCLRVADAVVGAVGVSGRTTAEDEELARIGAAAIGL